MQIRSKALALTLAVTLLGTAAAGEIYKWVDEDGNVHFEDRPVGEKAVERVDIPSRPTDPQRVQQQVQARLDRQAAAAEAAENASQGPSEEEVAAEEADRKQKCEMYTARLQSFVQNRHLYRELDDGERYYLTEEEMQSAREDVRTLIAENCN